MLSNILSIGLSGIEGYLVNCQVDISFGLPSWEMVGLPDATIKESKERVKTAIKNSGYEIHSRKVVINLCPAYTRKEGSSFDLAIALGVLCDIGVINHENVKDYICIGELSLDGNIERVSGILPMCIAAKKLGITKAIIPYDNRDEVGVLEDFEIYPVKNLKESVEFINFCNKESYKNSLKISNSNYIEDFKDVKGQESAKRGLEIAAAGFHNILMVGSPGTGKTMLAKRIPTILPDLEFDEAIEVTQIYSTAGLLKNNSNFITTRPFRAPHYTTTSVAMVGGGRYPKPGEISLAHNGILFMDEFAEFERDTIESLRTPLEEREITISRSNSSVNYPCNFMLVASMNPCPCGYANDIKRKCTCSNYDIQKYIKKVSGPIMDRIDIQVEVANVDYKSLKNSSNVESSKSIKERVLNARKIQKNRYKNTNIKVNSELNGKLIEEFCNLNVDAQKLLEVAYEKYSISMRSYERIIKLSRTIADLSESKDICVEHIAEAMQYKIFKNK